MSSEMSKYEKSALISIHDWKSPSLGWFGKGMEIVNKPIEITGEVLTEVPGVDWLLEKSFSGLVGILNDLAHWSVRPNAIYAEYRKAGYENINTANDIFSLDLEAADRVTGWVAAKYKTLAGAEGAGTGIVGAPGIPADIVAVIALNQRAIGDLLHEQGL